MGSGISETRMWRTGSREGGRWLSILTPQPRYRPHKGLGYRSARIQPSDPTYRKPHRNVDDGKSNNASTAREDVMKRLIVFLVLLALMATAGLADRRYVQVDVWTPQGAGGRLWIPAFNGETFLPRNIDFFYTSSTSGAIGSLVVYIPATSGPGSATDSVIIELPAKQSGYASHTYAGPISDTLHVIESVAWSGSFIAYK